MQLAALLQPFAVARNVQQPGPPSACGPLLSASWRLAAAATKGKALITGGATLS